MARSRSHRPFIAFGLGFALAAFTPGFASAQQTGQTGQTGQGGQTGGGGTSGLASADQIFSQNGGIQRAGSVDSPGLDSGGADSGTNAGGGAAGGRGAGGLGGFGGLGGLGGLSGLNQLFGGLNQSQQNQRTIRTRLFSGIEIDSPPPIAVTTRVNVRLDSIAASTRFQGVSVQMDGRKAILSGTVASESDKRMARLLVRLEPGISEVDNQLTVAQ